MGYNVYIDGCEPNNFTSNHARVFELGGLYLPDLHGKPAAEAAAVIETAIEKIITRWAEAKKLLPPTGTWGTCYGSLVVLIEMLDQLKHGPYGNGLPQEATISVYR